MHLLAFLMVSTVKYHSFKRVETFRRMTFNLSVMALLVLVFAAFQPAIALFLFGLAYVLSGPLICIRKKTTPQSGQSCCDRGKRGR
jgi:CDP-diacylglycerol--serine O-phosphatidyltransferase